jgi:simple sugar transport system ATP-binding protein
LRKDNLENENCILEFRNIAKTFLGVVANRDISLKIRQGEIHALLGENGAGKSTLMNVLVGLYTPDSGTIYVRRKAAHIRSPKDSIILGIGMVHQHYRLVGNLTVAENIIMGWHAQGWIIRKSKLYSHIADISQQYNLPIQPDAMIRDLSAGEKQRVEIVKMLYRNVEILVLDEPTSVLTPQERERLFDNLKKMRSHGKTVIFISHKLREIMAIADRVTVLRSGQLVDTIEKSAANPEKLAWMMIGRDMESVGRKRTNVLPKTGPVLTATDLVAKGDKGEEVLRGVSFSVAAGEIFGIAGVSGNGQSELAQVLTGQRPLVRGRIVFMGRDMTGSRPIDFIDAGVSHIPEDRIGVGTIPNFSCIENVILKSYRKPPIRRGFAINRRAAEEQGLNLLKAFDVRMNSPRSPLKLLSGGNIQKLILAREISCKPKFIVAVHPTYGLDVLAVEMVHKFLLKEQERGSAILLISEDLDEILSLSDTISVVYKGSLTYLKGRDVCSMDEIGQAMMGINSSARRGDHH